MKLSDEFVKSNLVGNVLNINTGDWIRRDSGIGAGIDSYYEYVAKAYILLGDETYLSRWNTHYASIMKYLGQVRNWIIFILLFGLFTTVFLLSRLSIRSIFLSLVKNIGI